MKMEVISICPFCGKAHSVFVPEEGYGSWMCGMSIQRAMPELTLTERKQLISNICPACQTRVFGENED